MRTSLMEGTSGGKYTPGVLGALEGHDVSPLAGVGAGDNGDDRVGVAGVEHFMGNAGHDEDEVAGDVLHDVFEFRAKFVTDPAVQYVKHHLEADVDVRGRDAAGRNRRDVHRQLP